MGNRSHSRSTGSSRPQASVRRERATIIRVARVVAAIVRIAPAAAIIRRPPAISTKSGTIDRSRTIHAAYAWASNRRRPKDSTTCYTAAIDPPGRAAIAPRGKPAPPIPTRGPPNPPPKRPAGGIIILGPPKPPPRKPLRRQTRHQCGHPHRRLGSRLRRTAGPRHRPG